VVAIILSSSITLHLTTIKKKDERTQEKVVQFVH